MGVTKIGELSIESLNGFVSQDKPNVHPQDLMNDQLENRYSLELSFIKRAAFFFQKKLINKLLGRSKWKWK